MSKEILTIANLDAGRLIEKVNQAILTANAALEESGTGTAKVVVEIAIKAADADGFFREVSSKVSVKTPTVVARKEMLPVQNVAGERAIVVDTTPAPVQASLPGVTVLADKRAV